MIALTWLYVPADRPDRVAKAMETSADVVIVDLEDAVAPGAKELARDGLADALATSAARRRIESDALQVRINALGTRWHRADLAAVGMLPNRVGLRLPKCEDSGLVRGLAQTVGHRRLHLLIESAVGVEAAYELARCDARVASIGLGEADLRADLGVRSEVGLGWSRSRIVNAAAAARLAAPAMSVYPDVADLDGLARSCAEGRDLGCFGRAAIHPRQLAVIEEAFRPTAEETEQARAILAAARDAETDAEASVGAGALALADGSFVDAAVVRQARRTLALADRPHAD